MASPWQMGKLIHEAATYKANHPHAWRIGIATAQLYCNGVLQVFRGLNMNDPKDLAFAAVAVPTTLKDVPGAVSFAINERLPLLIKEIIASPSFKTEGFEPTEETWAALAISFSMELDTLFTDFARKAEKVNAERLPASSSGCSVLVGLLLVALIAFVFWRAVS